MTPQQIQTVVIVGVLILLIGFRIYRQTREQRWSMKSMWVVPIIFAIITAGVVAFDTTTSVFAPLAALGGLGIGVAIGMYQGNHTMLRVDKPAHAVYIKVTPIGSLIFVVILALRFVIRFASMGGVVPDTSPGTLPPTTPAEALIGSGLLALAVGAITGLRLYVRRAYDAAPGTAPTVKAE